jgi:hypothetical protein
MSRQDTEHMLGDLCLRQVEAFRKKDEGHQARLVALESQLAELTLKVVAIHKATVGEPDDGKFIGDDALTRAAEPRPEDLARSKYRTAEDGDVPPSLPVLREPTERVEFRDVPAPVHRRTVDWVVGFVSGGIVVVIAIEAIKWLWGR